MANHYPFRLNPRVIPLGEVLPEEVAEELRRHFERYPEPFLDDPTKKYSSEDLLEILGRGGFASG